MKLNAAQQPFSVTVIGSGIFSALFAARYFIAPAAIEKPFTGGMPLAAALTGFSVSHPVWATAIVFLLLAWIAYIMIQLTVRYASATSRNYLPIPLFFAAACGIFVPAEALASYLAAFLVVLSTRQFISAFRKDYRFQEAFRGGFYLGMIPLLYAPGIVLLALIPTLMTLYRRSGREFVVSIAGALLPFAGAWFILWASGEETWTLFTELWRCLSVRGAALYPAGIQVMAAACGLMILALVAMGIAWYLGNRKGMRTRQRKVMAHISLTFALLAASFAAPGSSLSGLPLISVPAAMAIPYAFSGRQAVVSSVIYLLITGTVFAINLFALFGFGAL